MMLQTLVENAVKFMGEQSAPRIEIGADGSGRETVFFVRDNGIGIEAKNFERIFQVFQRLHDRAEHRFKLCRAHSATMSA